MRQGHVEATQHQYQQFYQSIDNRHFGRYSLGDGHFMTLGCAVSQRYIRNQHSLDGIEPCKEDKKEANFPHSAPTSICSVQLLLLLV